jgi:hypothetical protein
MIVTAVHPNSKKLPNQVSGAFERLSANNYNTRSRAWLMKTKLDKSQV